jgi:hypothetical protein
LQRFKGIEDGFADVPEELVRIAAGALDFSLVEMFFCAGAGIAVPRLEKWISPW